MFPGRTKEEVLAVANGAMGNSICPMRIWTYLIAFLMNSSVDDPAPVSLASGPGSVTPKL